MNGIAEDISASPGVLQTDLASVVAALEWVSAGIDMVSIAIMLIGAARFVVGFAVAETSRDGAARVQGIDQNRMELGRYILAGLELFIVSDIIHTALSLALNDLIFLGLLVLIRSAISFFLDREIREIREELGR
jgi:uncharacterized membrane protein